MATSLESLHLQNLRPIKLLGNGAMGTVFLVHDHLTDPSAHSKFALKVVDKCSLHDKSDADRRAHWEVSVLERLNQKPHPFLPSVIGSFEGDEIMAWAIPFCPGGDLNVLRHKQNDGVFSPSVIRFYLAEIVCALEHLHTMGIVYRDLKPENILIQSSGHVTLTDFDLSRALSPKSLSEPEIINNNNNHRKFTPLVKLKKLNTSRVSPMTRRTASFCSGERSNSFVGTDEYVAPEVVRGDGHEFAVDWWALGILSYEMLYGTTPFRGKNREDTFNRILTMPLKFTGKPTPLTDLITKLLDRDPTRRLGYGGGACEIKQHPFFTGLQWDLLTEVVRPPFIPSREDVESTSKVGCLTVTEYFENLRQPPLVLESPSRDDCGYNVSFTEF
ncbi:serine/threonine-protein kinase UCN-like [Bidens hawaiensis]|uniref:serine/threonine-protein kinase UCN-like n=1 Tax=Bidens hawaiensis TaxID=980011 RepID=UPI00404B1735